MVLSGTAFPTQLTAPDTADPDIEPRMCKYPQGRGKRKEHTLSNAISDLIPIKSTTRTIRECFRSCLYVVPGFQRPYSWNIDELEDYWDDVILAKGDFFFGSTVTWESESRELFNNTYSIIDGQQRLTTSAIALSVIRDSFDAVAKSLVISEGPAIPDGNAGLIELATSQAANTQKYILAIDDDGVTFPVIERDEPNFREVVQNPSAIPSGEQWNGSARQIGVAREFFEGKIRAQVSEDPAHLAIEKLKVIRNNLLKARVIQVELTSEEDGFLIFETLNTRGADLRLADLVKNLLVRGGASSAEDRKTIAQRWDRMVDKVQTVVGSMAAVDQFMWQSWNSRRAAVTEAELYKKILALVRDNPKRHLDYLAELEFDAVTYQYLDDPSLTIDKKLLSNKSALKLPEVADTLRALALFNVSVANSALLALVRKYEKAATLRKVDLIDACRSIENFHFQFTALKNSGSTGGTRGRYNRFAVELEDAPSSTTVRESIRALKVRLAGSLPNPIEAKEAFSKLFYAPKARLTNAQKRRSRKIFIAYILLKFAQIDEVLPPGQGLSAWTIEHIRPQSLASGGVGDPEFSIGNLVLLTSGANGNLEDGSLAEKRSGLQAYALWRDASLKNWLKDDQRGELEASCIASRAQLLADIAVDRTWSIDL